jgi:hypothetical protein
MTPDESPDVPRIVTIERIRYAQTGFTSMQLLIELTTRTNCTFVRIHPKSPRTKRIEKGMPKDLAFQISELSVSRMEDVFVKVVRGPPPPDHIDWCCEEVIICLIDM